MKQSYLLTVNNISFAAFSSPDNLNNQVRWVTWVEYMCHVHKVMLKVYRGFGIQVYINKSTYILLLSLSYSLIHNH